MNALGNSMSICSLETDVDRLKRRCDRLESALAVLLATLGETTVDPVRIKGLQDALAVLNEGS